MKLGAAMGEMAKPSKGGATKEAICESDAQCSDNEKCKSGNCVNVCNPSPCPSDEFCLNEGSHSYSCVECTSNDQCGGREICKNNSCVDACTGNPCSSKNQACSSQDGHSYICYGCVNNNACGGNEKCQGNYCTDVCSGNPCSSQGKLCQSNGSHGYSCYGCVNNNGCSNGKVCSSNQCVCPSGYEDDGNGGCKNKDPCANVSCGSGWHCENGSCVANACPAGYSTSVTSCKLGLELATNGYSGNKPCNICRQPPCRCPAGYGCCAGGTGCYRLPTKDNPSIGACSFM